MVIQLPLITEPTSSILLAHVGSIALPSTLGSALITQLPQSGNRLQFKSEFSFLVLDKLPTVMAVGSLLVFKHVSHTVNVRIQPLVFSYT